MLTRTQLLLEGCCCSKAWIDSDVFVLFRVAEAVSPLAACVLLFSSFVASAGADQSAASIASLLLLLLSLPQDIAAVRDAVLSAAGNAWHGARVATVDVMNYQYGTEVQLSRVWLLVQFNITLMLCCKPHVVLHGLRTIWGWSNMQGAVLQPASRLHSGLARVAAQTK